MTTTSTAPAPQVIGKCRKGHAVTGLWSDVRAGWIECPCGSPAMAKGMTIKHTDGKCGGRCTSSLGPVCNCSCDGRNHGADHRA
jgi:hypothetical protein